MPQIFGNNCAAVLYSSASGLDTNLQLESGHGTGFPNNSGGEWYYCTLVDPDTGDNEIVKVVARNGDVLLVDRGQDGTDVRVWPAGTIVEHRIVAATLRDLQDTAGDVEDVLGDYVLRAADTMTGPLGFTRNSFTWTLTLNTDGSYQLAGSSANSILYLHPTSSVGTGYVTVPRLVYAQPVREVSATTFNIVAGPGGSEASLIETTGAVDSVLTLQPGVGPTAWRRGQFFSVAQIGAGSPEVVGATGVTIHVPEGFEPIPRAQYSVISFSALSQTTWVASGDLMPIDEIGS